MIKKILITGIGMMLVSGNAYSGEDPDHERSLRVPPPSPMRSPAASGSAAESSKASPESRGSARAGRARARVAGRDWARESVGTAYTVSDQTARNIRRGFSSLRNLRDALVTALDFMGEHRELEARGYGSYSTASADGKREFIVDDRAAKRKPFDPELTEYFLDAVEKIVDERDLARRKLKQIVLTARDEVGKARAEARASEEAREAAETAMRRNEIRLRELSDAHAALQADMEARVEDAVKARHADVYRELTALRAKARGGAAVLTSPQADRKAARTPGSARARRGGPSPRTAKELARLRRAAAEADSRREEEELKVAELRRQLEIERRRAMARAADDGETLAPSVRENRRSGSGAGSARKPGAHKVRKKPGASKMSAEGMAATLAAEGEQ